MLKPVSEDAKRKCLNLCDDIGLVDAIRHHARKVRNLGDPSAVSLPFEFDFERHKGTLAFDSLPIKPLQPASGDELDFSDMNEPATRG